MYTIYTSRPGSLMLDVPLETKYVKMKDVYFGEEVNVDGEDMEDFAYTFGEEYGLDSNLLSYDGEYSLEYLNTAGDVIGSDSIFIVRPYIDVAAFAAANNVSSAVAMAAEEYTRNVINAYTSTSFGKHNRDIYISGNNTKTLMVPERIINLNSISIDSFILAGSSEFILERPYKVHLGRGISGYYNIFRLRFEQSRTYTLSGEFGWQVIPSKVLQAAELIAQDFISKQRYAGKGIGTIRAADWSLSYRDEVFQGTGVIQADNLLKEYIVTHMDAA